MKNKYRIVEDDVYIEIVCNGEVIETVVSLSSLSKLKNLDVRWYGKQSNSGIYVAVNKYFGYIDGKTKTKRIALHRYLVDCPEGYVVDHINCNPLDNRIENLNITTKANNNQNLKPGRKNNTTGHRGVVIQNGKWKAQIRINKTNIHLGYFKTLEEAANARKYAERKYHSYLVSINKIS